MAAKNSKENFYFTIDRTGQENSHTTFRFHQPGRGRQAHAEPLPDFRQFTGIMRELLREFLARKKTQEYVYDFDGADFDGNTLTNPDDRLVRQALAAGLLRNAQGKIL